MEQCALFIFSFSIHNCRMQNCCLLLLLLHASPAWRSSIGLVPPPHVELLCFGLGLGLQKSSPLILPLSLPLGRGWATCCVDSVVGIGLGIGGSSSTTHPNAWELRRPCFEVTWKRLFAEFQMRKKTLCKYMSGVCSAACCVSGKKLNKS